MKKSELAKAAGISAYAMSKLNNDKPVSMEIMINLCQIFHCDIGDLMEVIEKEMLRLTQRKSFIPKDYDRDKSKLVPEKGKNGYVMRYCQD